MFFNFINYIIFFVLLLSLVFIIKAPTDDNFYIEAGYNNPNCASGPWSFCPEIYKLNINKKTSEFRETNDYMEITRSNASYPFACVHSAQPYCRRIGEDVLISIPFWNAKNLTKTEIPGYQKCLVSNLSNYSYEKKKSIPEDFFTDLSCKVIDSVKMTRYAKCAWKENKLMLVFKSPRRKILDMKNVEYKLKGFNELEIDIEKCFKGFQNNKIFNFWENTEIDFK